MHTEKGIYNNRRFHFLGVMSALKSCQFLLSTSNQFDPLPPKKSESVEFWQYYWTISMSFLSLENNDLSKQSWSPWRVCSASGARILHHLNGTRSLHWSYTQRGNFGWSYFLINREICDREQGSRDLLKFWFFLSVRLIKTKRTRSMYNSANSRISGGCLY